MADDTSTTDQTEPEEPTGDQPEEPTEPDPQTDPSEPEPAAAQGDEPSAKDEKPETKKADDKLGDPGKRALENERKARRDAEKELKALRTKVREFEDRDKSDLERAQSRAAELEQQVAAAQSRAVRAEVKAQASATFADPDDAAAFLDLSKYADGDGEIDAEQIAADLSELLERKPHLAKPAPAPEPRRPAPDRSQGSSGNRKTTTDPEDEFAGFVRSQLVRKGG